MACKLLCQDSALACGMCYVLNTFRVSIGALLQARFSWQVVMCMQVDGKRELPIGPNRAYL
jgi:hypothetical protein